MKELTKESTKLDELLAAYGEEYDLPDPLDAEDEEEDRYDGYKPEPYYDYLESQYEEAKENGLLLSLTVLQLGVTPTFILPAATKNIFLIIQLVIFLFFCSGSMANYEFE
jgi:hypothetical protein